MLNINISGSRMINDTFSLRRNVVVDTIYLNSYLFIQRNYGHSILVQMEY